MSTAENDDEVGGWKETVTNSGDEQCHVQILAILSLILSLVEKLWS